MAYTIPESAVSDSVLTTVFWNAQVKDNISYLYSTVNSTQGSVAATQGSVVTINSTLSTTQSLVANTQGSVVATQGSVAATQGSVVALSNSLSTIQYTGTAITSGASSGTVYSVGTADAGKILLCYAPNGISGTVQLPLNATQPFAIGQKVDLIQMGSGVVTVTIASGGTLNYTPSNVLRTRFSAASMVKVNTNEWVLMGDLY
jgi:hypothetical protein